MKRKEKILKEEKINKNNFFQFILQIKDPEIVKEIKKILFKYDLSLHYTITKLLERIFFGDPRIIDILDEIKKNKAVNYAKSLEKSPEDKLPIRLDNKESIFDLIEAVSPFSQKDKES